MAVAQNAITTLSANSRAGIRRRSWFRCTRSLWTPCDWTATRLVLYNALADRERLDARGVPLDVVDESGSLRTCNTDLSCELTEVTVTRKLSQALGNKIAGTADVAAAVRKARG